MTEAAIVGVLGLVVLAISAYLHVNDKDGSEWGFVALLLTCDMKRRRRRSLRWKG